MNIFSAALHSSSLIQLLSDSELLSFSCFDSDTSCGDSSSHLRLQHDVEGVTLFAASMFESGPAFTGESVGEFVKSLEVAPNCLVKFPESFEVFLSIDICLVYCYLAVALTSSP